MIQTWLFGRYRSAVVAFLVASSLCQTRQASSSSTTRGQVNRNNPPKRGKNMSMRMKTPAPTSTFSPAPTITPFPTTTPTSSAIPTTSPTFHQKKSGNNKGSQKTKASQSSQRGGFQSRISTTTKPTSLSTPSVTTTSSPAPTKNKATKVAAKGNHQGKMTKNTRAKDSTQNAETLFPSIMPTASDTSSVTASDYPTVAPTVTRSKKAWKKGKHIQSRSGAASTKASVNPTSAPTESDSSSTTPTTSMTLSDYPTGTPSSSRAKREYLKKDVKKGKNVPSRRSAAPTNASVNPTSTPSESDSLSITPTTSMTLSDYPTIAPSANQAKKEDPKGAKGVAGGKVGKEGRRDMRQRKQRNKTKAPSRSNSAVGSQKNGTTRRHKKATRSGQTLPPNKTLKQRAAPLRASTKPASTKGRSSKLSPARRQKNAKARRNKLHHGSSGPTTAPGMIAKKASPARAKTTAPARVAKKASSKATSNATIAKGIPRASRGPKGAGTVTLNVTSAKGSNSTIDNRSQGKKGPLPSANYRPPPGKKGTSKQSQQGPISNITRGARPNPKTSKPYRSPTSRSSSSGPISNSTSKAGQAFGSANQVFAKVKIPIFSCNYTVTSVSATPSGKDYGDLNYVTAILLDDLFYSYFVGGAINDTQYYSTAIVSDYPTSSFAVEFEAECNFLLPTITPTPGQLASVLKQKFSEKSYLDLLHKLGEDNAFSKTSSVALDIDPNVLQYIGTNSSITVGGNVNTSSKVNVTMAASIGAAALVAFAATAALLFASRKRSKVQDGKKSPSDMTQEDTATVAMDSSCYNSVVSRSKRSNRTNEFGGGGVDERDDCRSQASTIFSLSKSLPTIGEGHDGSGCNEVDGSSLTVGHRQQLQQKGRRQSKVSAPPTTTDEMSLSEVPLYEDSEEDTSICS